MKIFIMAYIRENLGDDLFIEFLTKKYPNEEFFINIPGKKCGKSLKDIKNLTIYDKPDTDVELQNLEISDYDAFVYIGGSIFMEGGKVYNLSEVFFDFIIRVKENNKPLFYISSNYGPYQTQEYFDLSKRAYNNITDICFRDRYSYNLFKEISSVRYAPDLVFSYQDETISKIEKEENNIGISIINMDIRDFEETIRKDYYKMMENTIKEYINLGKKVYLFSFCEHEGDMLAIEKITNKLPNELKEQIEIVNYDGDLNKYFKIYKKMSYMICARFHAMILSVAFGQKYYVISYSNKINNVIEDLELGKEYLDLRNLDNSNIIELNKFNSISDERRKEIFDLATEQFKAFDEFIKVN